MSTRIVRHPEAVKAAREAVAFGLLNAGYAVETAWKRDVVVRGGHRSFKTMLTKGGTPEVGGTLRRSIHTAAYLDGSRIGGEATDENGETPPTYAAGTGMTVFVGTNSGYGGFVEAGTVKMPARPAGVPAVLSTRDEFPALIAAGARRHAGQ